MAFARTSKLATALVSALAVVPVGGAAVALSVPAHAQSDAANPPPPAPPAPKPGPEAQEHRMGPHGGRDEWRKHRHHFSQSRHAMRIAKRLAAVEVAIGIRSDQLDAWRRFTSLVVAFASPDWPDMAMAGSDEDADDEPTMAPDAVPGDQPPAGDTAAPSAPDANTSDTEPDTVDTEEDTDLSAFGPLGFMVDRAIERGDEAKELKDAMAKLDAVLTPEQKQAARMLMRHDRHGMRARGHWGHHGDWGDDDRDDRHGSRM